MLAVLILLAPQRHSALMQKTSLISPTNEEVRLTTIGQVCPGKSLAKKKPSDSSMIYFTVLWLCAFDSSSGRSDFRKSMAKEWDFEKTCVSTSDSSEKRGCLGGSHYCCLNKTW
jgi:hypothetical protein